MIELSDVTRVYPMGSAEVRALDGVSLSIAQGEFVAIIGSSGSGKSTMMHILGCLDRPTAGRYSLLNRVISGMGDRELARVRNRSIGFVFQTFNLISRMSAWENVAMPLFYARQSTTRPQAIEALERVGLGERATHLPNELSGGERQRVAIARAIVNDPQLILADEPTGNLDTATGEQIMAIFHELHAAGVTIVIVTHEPEIAAQAQRIIKMRDGKIVSDAANTQRRISSAAGTSDPDQQPDIDPPDASTGQVARWAIAKDASGVGKASPPRDVVATKRTQPRPSLTQRALGMIRRGLSPGVEGGWRS